MKTNKEWVGISDLMSGLMMIFLFVAIAFMYDNENKVKALNKQDIPEKEMVNIEVLKQQVKQLQSQIEINKSVIQQEKILHSKLENEQLQSQVKKNKILQNQLKNNILELSSKKIKEEQLNRDINLALFKEFENDLNNWDARILKDNTIIFQSPNILFKSDSSEISQRFKIILNSFFPRYIKVLHADHFKSKIKNIKIIGHTSSIWNWNRRTKEQEIYFNHMELSQERSLSVLKYCYLNNLKYKYWLSSILESSGLSYSQTVKFQNKENIKQSHRVEFKIIKTSALTKKTLSKPHKNIFYKKKSKHPSQEQIYNQILLL